MRALIFNSFVLALASCLLGMGAILLPQYTLSPRSVTHTIDRYGECLYVGQNWDCMRLPFHGPLEDTGAIGWVEIPSAQFAHDFGPLAHWNPFIGAGYPEFLNGHYRASAMSRLLLSAFPGDDGRDLNIFLRFLVWSWGFAFLVSLFGASRKTQFFAGLLSQLIPYVAIYLDHVFMDVDMLAPWLLVGLVLTTRTKAQPKLRKVLWGAAFLFGLWVGLQSFLQAQVIFLLIAGLLTLINLPATGVIGFVPALLLATGCITTMLPEVIKFLVYFPELISSRLPGSCYITAVSNAQVIVDGLWKGLYKNQDNAFIHASALGLPLFLLSIKNKDWRWLAFGGATTSALILFGLPGFLCKIQGLNGIYFFRHATPYVQSIFFSSIFIGFIHAKNLLTNSKIPQAKVLRPLLTILISLGVITFVKKGFVSELAFTSNKLVQLEHAKKPPENHFISMLNKISIEQNRRHISIDENLYPNWPAVFHIYDVRVLEAVYPKYSYELMSQLLTGWKSDSRDPLKPDRYVTALKPWDDSWQRFLTIFRISIISHKDNFRFLPSEGWLSQKNCNAFPRNTNMLIYDCPQVGAIDYFPAKILAVDPAEVIGKLNTLPLGELKDLAIISSEEPTKTNQEIEPGQGTIDLVEKTADIYSYELTVSKPGLFVISDTYFKGWTANINGQPAPIIRVNHAFKGVLVPAGKVHLKLSFIP